MTRPIWSQTGPLTTTPIAIALPSDWAMLKVLVTAQSYGRVGATYTPPAIAPVNGVITIRSLGSPTGGTWQARINPQDTNLSVLTAAVAYNASAATIKSAFTGTGLFVSGDITAAGGALPADVTLTFTGVYAGTTPRIEIVNTNITGAGSIAALVTTQSKGNGGYGYLEANAQEVWSTAASGGRHDKYLHLATVSGTGTYYVSALR